MSAAWSERVGRVGGYPPLSGLSDLQRREFHEALLDADTFEDLPGKWQAAILKAEHNRPQPAHRQEPTKSPTRTATGPPEGRARILLPVVVDVGLGASAGTLRHHPRATGAGLEA